MAELALHRGHVAELLHDVHAHGVPGRGGCALPSTRAAAQISSQIWLMALTESLPLPWAIVPEVRNKAGERHLS